MSTALSTQPIEELWQSFKPSNPSGRDEITVEGLRKVMQSLGHEPTEEELRHILFDADATGSITFEKFVALAAGEFLKQTYDFDPDLEDDAPHFSPEEEAFGRSGVFVEA